MQPYLVQMLLNFGGPSRDQLWKLICTTCKSGLSILSPDTDVGFGFSLVRFEATYPKSGFGILRLTPKYEPLPMLAWSPELGTGAIRDKEAPTLDYQVPQRTVQNRTFSSIIKKQEEVTLPDEIWDRLPAWMRTLHNIRRRARQDPPTDSNS
jgi:hypothetical protein